MKSTRTRRRAALLVAVISLLAVLSACSTKSQGIDIAKEIDKQPSLSRATEPVAGIDAAEADATWTSAGTNAEVVGVLSAMARPDEVTTTTDGNSFLLYRSGTLWVTETGNTTAVVLYRNNDTAYRRHSGALIGYAAWSSRMSGYRSGGSSSRSGNSGGNSFRGGGSGSGK